MPAPAGQLFTFRACFHYQRPAYVTIRVFDSTVALRAFASRHRQGDAFGPSYWALATTWTRSSPRYGEILLSRQHLTIEVIAHECGHILLGYAARRGLRLTRPLPPVLRCSRDEEHFCSALGGLVGSVTAGLQSHAVPTRSARRKAH